MPFINTRQTRLLVLSIREHVTVSRQNQLNATVLVGTVLQSVRSLRKTGICY